MEPDWTEPAGRLTTSRCDDRDGSGKKQVEVFIGDDVYIDLPISTA